MSFFQSVDVDWPPKIDLAVCNENHFATVAETNSHKQAGDDEGSMDKT